MATKNGVGDVDARIAELQHRLGLILAAMSAVAAGADEVVTPADGAGDPTIERNPIDSEPQLPKLISISRAAAVLGISRASAYRYAACGDLPTVRLGGRLFVITARLKAFLDVA